MSSLSNASGGQLMPFREKSAWISLVCLVTVFGGFSLAGRFIAGGRAALFFGCVTAFVVLRIVLHVIATATAPEDARAPLDERERLIGLMAGRNANIALIAGVMAVPLSMHMGVQKPEMGYVAMMAIIVAEIVREVSRISYF